MWLWRAETGLWEQDAAAPLGFHGNLTAIAFSPVDPAVGYAVGKQGVLLAYDKTWTQQALPPGLEQANFTSVAFAGAEALATYRKAVEGSALCGARSFCEVGGLIVNNGSGWEVDPSAKAAARKPAQPARNRAVQGCRPARRRRRGRRARGRDRARLRRLPLALLAPAAARSTEHLGASCDPRRRGSAGAGVDRPRAREQPQPRQTCSNIDAFPPPGFGQPFGAGRPRPASLHRLSAAGDTPKAGRISSSRPIRLPTTLGVTGRTFPTGRTPCSRSTSHPSGSAGLGGRRADRQHHCCRKAPRRPPLQTAAALRLGSGRDAAAEYGGADSRPRLEQATFAVGGNARARDLAPSS